MGVVFIDLDVEHIDVCEAFEEDRLPLHHRLCGECADATESENCRTVRDDSHQVAARRVA